MTVLPCGHQQTVPKVYQSLRYVASLKFDLSLPHLHQVPHLSNMPYQHTCKYHKCGISNSNTITTSFLSCPTPSTMSQGQGVGDSAWGGHHRFCCIWQLGLLLAVGFITSPKTKTYATGASTNFMKGVSSTMHLETKRTKQPPHLYFVPSCSFFLPQA